MQFLPGRQADERRRAEGVAVSIRKRKRDPESLSAAGSRSRDSGPPAGPTVGKPGRQRRDGPKPHEARRREARGRQPGKAREKTRPASRRTQDSQREFNVGGKDPEPRV